jgi:hypothetical protein
MCSKVNPILTPLLRAPTPFTLPYEYIRKRYEPRVVHAFMQDNLDT